MASMNGGNAETPKHRVAIGSTPAVEVPQYGVRFSGIEEQLDELTKALKEVGMAATAILSGQDIARRFESVRDELLARIDKGEKTTATVIEAYTSAVAERITDHEASVEMRIAALESLSFGTLLRLMVRRILGR